MVAEWDINSVLSVRTIDHKRIEAWSATILEPTVVCLLDVLGIFRDSLLGQIFCGLNMRKVN